MSIERYPLACDSRANNRGHGAYDTSSSHTAQGSEGS